MNICITGATKGIGKAIAEKFASNSFNIAICSRNSNELTQLKEELEEKSKIKVLAKVCDVSSKAELKEFGAFIKEHWDKLDILINNAGLFLPGQTIEEEEGTIESQIETNLYSAYYMTREMLPIMQPHRSGSIFNVCSVASLAAYPNGGSYSISKFGLLGYTKALRQELKDFNIKVTALNLGAVYTSSWEGTDLPESRFIDPVDVASLVFDIYSLSERSVVEEILVRPLMGDI